MDQAQENLMKRANYETAKKIIKTLVIEPNNPGILEGLKMACADCEHYGPKEGRPCMSLKLAREMGCEYTPPEWCKEKS